MIRTIAAVIAVSLAAMAPALAADQQVVIAGTNPQTVHAKLVAAADRLCARARADDPFGDYGTQEECIENTVDHARVRHVPYQAEYTQRVTR